VLFFLDHPAGVVEFALFFIILCSHGHNKAERVVRLFVRGKIDGLGSWDESDLN